ncbi:hypothetical protein FNAPI_3798 [Fusarium napiforme]|uniref:Small s protein n=1 Tax=Fusarium napiforme TaxID=42672 RepID=A0A8H5NCN2_9HYPO|nr:hypothetical protein FNAPI_3798 [Fusarium napiforme]
MATGLEALGAASAVISLISFAGSLASLTMKIYDGIPTAENELEDYATRMLDAATRVKSRQVPRGTLINDKLSEVSQRTIDAAGELEKATRNISAQKGNRLKAFCSAIRAKRNRAKINELSKSLGMCKEVMETELLSKICDQDTALAQQQSRGFRSLEVDVQNLILKIAEGYTRVEQLVSIEAQATRDAINTHVTSEFKALGIKNISDNQAQRLLKSLKPEEIRERYNAVLPSSDACFERVFASYERVCRNDPGYKALRGYEKAFGHDSENISENISENSSENKSENVLSEEESGESDEVDDIDHIWECFSTWLQSDDKLFWIRGKPGSGKSTLIKFLINNDNTKHLLGSWHPNTRILSHFFWKIGSEPQNSIRDDLTKPEMAVYLQKEFEKLPKEQSAALPIEQFREELLRKAQGVFLWLCLASKSVMHGILNGDDRETLSKRLDELPEELESLYQKMWERLNGANRVYRQTAARYFRFAIADGWSIQLWTKKDEITFNTYKPNLVQLSLAVKAEDGLIFPPKANEMKLSELNAMCAAAEIDIQIRCAGMLQVSRHSDFEVHSSDMQYSLTRPVQFIHRTAHDFLVDTEHGQSILGLTSNETKLVGEHLKLLKCQLNLANTYYRELEFVSDSRTAIDHCNRLNRKGVNPEAILEILRTVKDLYEDGVLRRGSLAENNTPFPCVMAYYLESFDDFIISSFMPTPSPELATKSLHELALASQYFRMSKTSARIIRVMIELGGDAHVAKKSRLPFELGGREMLTLHTTAFESFLCGALEPLNDHAIRQFLDVSEILVQTCPDLYRRVMVLFREDGCLLTYRLQEWGDAWVALEVDLQFLINWLLANADSKDIPTQSSQRIRGLAASFTKHYVRIRHIVLHRKEDTRARCYRVLNQEPYLDVINSLGYCKKFSEAIKAHLDVLDAMDDPIDSSTNSESSFPSDCVEEVPIEKEMEMILQEGIGLYIMEKRM